MKIKILAAGLSLLASGALHADEPRPFDMESTRRFTQQDGDSLFKGVCAACHMPDAIGATGAATYPALAKNEKLAAASYPVMMVMNGHGGMPSFRNSMTDIQIAAVVGYVRTHFGNSYADPVSPDDVRQVREAR